ncbi:MAG: hypothetical protein E6I49_02140 [Chloroflexi bacterium]|nr:MAG: hypothetical protein E6I49_02140 [Chloroflexota bacterium]
MAARVLLVIALLLIVAVAVVAIFARSRQDTTGLASPIPSPTATATPSPSPTSTPSPTLRPSSSPTASASATATFAGTPYVNTTWQYSLVLPPPYRHSDLLSFKSIPPEPQQPKASDAFTARTLEDERATSSPCETSCPAWNYVVTVEVWTNAGSMSPREWVDSGHAGFFAGQKVEDTTISGRPAVRVTSAEGRPFKWLVAKEGRMYVLDEMVNDQMPVPPGASRDKLDAIVASFNFL